MPSKILITGTAGFIGFHLVQKLVQQDYDIVGLDNINDYYDVNLKYGRLQETGIPRDKIENGKLVDSEKYDRYRFVKMDLEDKDGIASLFRKEKFDYVVHLAAQAGVRYSLVNPHAYINSNITGFLNILEGCRHFPVQHLIYASSSSVYGANTKMPFSTKHNVDHPVSLYAATKKANELMAHTYSHLFALPTTGLRFFTVYGPWGRPDMALFLFTKAILAGEPIQVFNHGRMRRDFTYVDDVTEGVVRVLDRVPVGDPAWDGDAPDPGASRAPYRVYNIGNHRPVELMRMIEVLEDALGATAIKHMTDIQPGDVPATFADVAALERDVGFTPSVSIEEGVPRFVAWYRSYYGV